MKERVLLVKIFDVSKNKIGVGSLLSITKDTIIVKGNSLPVLKSGLEITINVYDERIGISPYLCLVSVATRNQLTATIVRRESIIERRSTIKVRTDLSFYISKIYRNDEDISEEIPPVKINLLNLSIGGMLISSNFDFMLGDTLTFYFRYINLKPIHLEARVIRIDDVNDPDSIQDVISHNYGCIFNGVTMSEESIILKYLFERQLQLYKNK